MKSVEIKSTNGGMASLNGSALESFSASFQGKLLGAGDAGYDDAREIWNAMIDRRPALIAQCSGAADVKAAVNLAREHNLLTAIRSGGHNIAGNAVCDDGLVIDLSSMKAVDVDTKTKRAHVGPGATLGDFDRETQKANLTTPVGINSTTGIAGLTLGGGFGWLSRKYGVTADNLVAADVVTADGELHTVSEGNHPDLFWAIRGGGGNFGVVTRFEYKLHPFGPDVLSGLLVFSLDEALPILKKYREWVKNLDDESTVWVVMRKAPPLPFLPEDVHGKEVLVLALFHAGDPDEGTKLFEPLKSFGTLLGEHVGVQPYTNWQQAFDPLLTPGARNYWKSHNFTELSDDLLKVTIEYVSKLPSPHCEIFFGFLAGEVNRVAPDATAYAHRDIDFVMNVHGRWEDASEDDKCIGWSREFFQKSQPFAASGVYVNFMTEDEAGRVESAFGPNFNKLAKAKKQYDPDNLFRLNHNIAPAD